MKTTCVFFLLVILYNARVVSSMEEKRLQPYVDENAREVILRQRERIRELEQQLAAANATIRDFEVKLAAAHEGQQLTEASITNNTVQQVQQSLEPALEQALRLKFAFTPHLLDPDLRSLSVASTGMNKACELEFGMRVQMVKQLMGSLRLNESEILLSAIEEVKKSSSQRQQLSHLRGIHRKLLERKALTALYDNINGDGWNNKRNWKSNTDICEWHGVTCNLEKSVIQLELSRNNLIGSIPKEIGQLTNLKELKLDNNYLSGPIPSEIGQLKILEYLRLNDNNELSGSIPSEIGQLKNVRHLSLHSNELSGVIPKEIGQITKLTRLYLNENKLSGPIPNEIGQLTNLERLYLNDNNLSGSIPTAIGQLTKLKELYLHKNNLFGPIPKEMGQLTNLVCLILRDNNLSGPIPNEIRQLPNIVVDE